MMRMFKFELHRMFHNIFFWISIASTCILSVIASLEQLNIYLKGMDHISVFYRWIGHINLMFGSRYLFIVLPLFISTAYSLTGCNDKKQGYINNLLSRCSRRRYFICKYIVSFISGGIIFCLPIIINFMILSLFMPVEIPDPVNMTSIIDQLHFCSRLFYTKPLVFVLLWLITAFLWGGVIALIGLITGFFTDNIFSVISAPFMIFIGEGVLGSYIMRKGVFSLGYYSLELVWEDMFYSGTPGAAPTDYILGTILTLQFIITIIYYVKVYKYECI